MQWIVGIPIHDLGHQLGHLRRDEHCQHLSVTLPADLAPGESLPVMVWVHGGVHGNWGINMFPFVREAVERGYVVICPEYRGSTGYGREYRRRLKLRYATQVKARPPTFALFASKPEDLPDAYQRYLVNNLREAFDLPCERSCAL